MREPGATSWVDITGNQAPITIYWSVEALPRGNTLRFGTYGRGIWDYKVGRGRLAEPGESPTPAALSY